VADGRQDACVASRTPDPTGALIEDPPNKVSEISGIGGVAAAEAALTNKQSDTKQANKPAIRDITDKRKSREGLGNHEIISSDTMTLAVLGGSRGIGLATARLWLQQQTQSSVFLVGRRQESVDGAVQALAKEFGADRVEGRCGDLSRDQDVERLAMECRNFLQSKSIVHLLDT
jgi:hypothetical protein